MDSRQLNELMESKVSVAHSQGLAARFGLGVLLLAVLFGVSFMIYRANHPPEIVPQRPSGGAAQSAVSDESSAGPGEGSSGQAEVSSGEDSSGLIDHQLQIVWFDVDPAEIEEPIQITVLHGDELAADFTLTAESDWKYEWQDSFHAEEMTLMGSFAEDMSVSFSISGENFTLTAAYQQPAASGAGQAAPTSLRRSADAEPAPTAQGDSTLPQTGAEWFPVVCLLSMGFWIVLVGCGLSEKRE